MRQLVFVWCLVIPIILTGQSNSKYAQLLSKYVSQEGSVDYQGFIEEKLKLEQYLNFLSENPPQKNWDEKTQKAYWINVYNAFTVKLVVDHYPISSINELHPFPYIPLVNSVWKKEFFKIGGEKMSLHQVEHDILRKKFNDPRIHMAINCASISCPKLRNEPYEATKLEAQLSDQCKQFIRDGGKNKLGEDELKLSKIFAWYAADFKNSGGIIHFINGYLPYAIDDEISITYLKYNWQLNE